MQRLEVSGAVRPIYGSLGAKGLSSLATQVCSSLLYPLFVDSSLLTVSSLSRCVTFDWNFLRWTVRRVCSVSTTQKPSKLNQVRNLFSYMQKNAVWALTGTPTIMWSFIFFFSFPAIKCWNGTFKKDDQILTHRLQFNVHYYPIGRSQWPYCLTCGLRPFASWDCGFESRHEYGCLSLVLCVVR